MIVSGFLKFGLSHALALLTLVAVWTANYRIASDIASMRAELEAYAKYTPVLLVDDPGKLAVLLEPIKWSHEVSWQAYVPEDSTTVLQVTQTSTRPPFGDDAEVIRIPLEPGRHSIKFCHFRQTKFKSGEKRKEEIYLIIDGEETLVGEQFVSRNAVRKSIPGGWPGNQIELDPDDQFELLAPSFNDHLPYRLIITPLN